MAGQACNIGSIKDRVEFLGVLPGRDAIFEWLDTIDISTFNQVLPKVCLELHRSDVTGSPEWCRPALEACVMLSTWRFE